MKPLPSLFAVGFAFVAVSGRAGTVPGSLDVPWDPGSEDCPHYTHSPLEVHQYDSDTFVLRESLCETWEAPFMYLLVGGERALLIDTGDVADQGAMPLAKTVLKMLPGDGPSKRPLLVTHSHGHLDHREGDGQFAHLPNVQVVPSDLESMRRFFGLKDWPNGIAELDLGGRVVDVLPAPGHHPAAVVFYDRNTSLLFTGDFLLPGRILVNDLAAFEMSAQRVADFLKDKPVRYVLGGHIEKNKAGELLGWQSTYHPDEHPLALSKADVMALPAALHGFNGFYTTTGGLIIENPIHDLIAVGLVAVLLVAGLVHVLLRYVRRRRARGGEEFSA
jgi:glyoxylase-like metal-dependent hydrolase (beta-lactamase superfamily II)